MLPMIAVLLVPILPFVLFGTQLEAWWNAWQSQPRSGLVIASVVIGLLATDVFLPVPSSVVATLAGYKLGVMGGTLAAWFGMSLGAAIGFALARRWGQRLVAWLTRPDDLDRTNRLVDAFGPTMLVVGRGVPVLAEATVLIMGMHGLSWRRFLPPMLLSNLGLALAYAAFGEVANRYHWLPLALAISIAVPVLLAVGFRFWTRDGIAR
jgi:membrane protein DedA with SNARE-associated domain